MTNILNDGSVLPSYLSATPMGMSMSGGEFDSQSLMVGEIKEIVYPTDKKSMNKKFIEYRVSIQYRQGQDPAASVDFVNCTLINSFGGHADQFRYTLRPDDAQQAKKTETFGVGSKVVVLCLNGESSRGLIIGGIRESTDTPDAKADGHNLYFEFNGISFSINKDGEATLQFKGSTKVDGTALEATDESTGPNPPTTLKIDKKGVFTLKTSKDTMLEISDVKDDAHIKLTTAGKHVLEISDKKSDEHIKITHSNTTSIIDMDVDGKIHVKSAKKVVVACDLIHLGVEDPSDNLALAKLVKAEIKKLRDTVKALVSAYNGHTHPVKGIKTAGSPSAQSQTAPVDSGKPDSSAEAPEPVEDVKSVVVFAK